MDKPGEGGVTDKALLTQGTLTLLARKYTTDLSLLVVFAVYFDRFPVAPEAFTNASYILLQRKLLQPPRNFPVLTLTACGFVVAACCMVRSEDSFSS